MTERERQRETNMRHQQQQQQHYWRNKLWRKIACKKESVINGQLCCGLQILSTPFQRGKTKKEEESKQKWSRNTHLPEVWRKPRLVEREGRKKERNKETRKETSKQCLMGLFGILTQTNPKPTKLRPEKKTNKQTNKHMMKQTFTTISLPRDGPSLKKMDKQNNNT